MQHSSTGQRVVMFGCAAWTQLKSFTSQQTKMHPDIIQRALVTRITRSETRKGIPTKHELAAVISTGL